MLTELSIKRKVLQPDSFYSPSRKDKNYDLSSDRIITNDGYHEKIRTPPENPDMELWRQGFTRNPVACIHERKRFTGRWRCLCCGEWLT